MTSTSSDVPTSGELAALSRVCFERLDAAAILDHAAAAVATLGPCRTEATYRVVDNVWERWPESQTKGPDIDRLVTESGGDGPVQVPERGWGWAFPLLHRDTVSGSLIVSATTRPSSEHMLLLTVLARQTGAALMFADLLRRDERCAAELGKANTDLANAQQRLRSRTRVHEAIEAALAGGGGEQGITDALHRLTALPVTLEDRFGNLRSWAGPGPPGPYPKPDPQRRQRQLDVLADCHLPMRMKDRIAALIQPRGEVLGVLAIVDPHHRVTEDHIFALQYACTVLGYELSHQRNLAEMELGVRRELVDDLLAGTDDDGAYARAEALGHDLRRPHYVIVVHSPAGSDSTVATAAGRAAAALHLNSLQGRSSRLVVLLTEGRPDPRAFHRTLSELLGRATNAIGIGSRCQTPSDFPKSFAEAQRALNVRLHSAAPAGASAYDELGFYRLIDAAHGAGAVEDFIREWLGALLDYDTNKKSQLVYTLSEYLESGGNYDESAKALHIHRSTLRYRLARIGELTGYDLRKVDTRFNLHAATRSWRFLYPDGVH
jgi:sugar diacid utilization regulator